LRLDSILRGPSGFWCTSAEASIPKWEKKYFIFADQVSCTEHGCSFKFTLIRLFFLLRVIVSNLIKSSRLPVGFCLTPSSRAGTRRTRNRGPGLHETVPVLLIGPSNSLDDRDDGPTVGASCRCLNHSTSMGGTRSKVEGGDRHDLEPEGTRKDTRHKIYTGSGSRSSYPTSCLE
jgi:hypothetical protein